MLGAQLLWCRVAFSMVARRLHSCLHGLLLGRLWSMMTSTSCRPTHEDILCHHHGIAVGEMLLGSGREPSWGHAEFGSLLPQVMLSSAWVALQHCPAYILMRPRLSSRAHNCPAATTAGEQARREALGPVSNFGENSDIVRAKMPAASAASII